MEQDREGFCPSGVFYSWEEEPDNIQGSKQVLFGQGTCCGRNETEQHQRREIFR